MAAWAPDTTEIPLPYTGTHTRRRDIRQGIRNALGTSRSGAPNIFTLLSAAREMSELVELTSGGRYALALEVDNVTRPITDVRAELLAIRDGKAA